MGQQEKNTMRPVPEWKGHSDGSAVPPRVRLRVLYRSNGACAICTREIIGSFAVDHIQALVNGGENVESNLQALCAHCHSVKTKADVAEKALVTKRKMKHHGLGNRKGFRGWRKFDGSVVRSDEK